MQEFNASVSTTPSPGLSFQPISTRVGWLHGVWTYQGLYAIRFAEEAGVKLVNANDAKQVADSLKWKKLAKAMHLYFETGRFDWPVESLDWTGSTPFQKAVLKECLNIPSGETRTYGQLADAVEKPNSSRAVGGVMARNRWPILIPCHRVVGANGSLTGYSGAGGLITKQSLLDWERAQLENQAHQSGALLF